MRATSVLVVCACALFAGNQAHAVFTDVTSAGDDVAGTQLSLADGSLDAFTNFPGAEGPDKAIDDSASSGSKYLSFTGAGLNDNGEQAFNPTGFVVVLDAPAAIGGVQFMTANDFASRDPGVVQIFGTNLPGTASDIASLATAGDLTEVYYGATGVPAFATVDDGRGVVTPPQLFPESDPFAAYVVIVRDLVRYDGNAPTNFQFAEISLLQVPEPSTVVMVGLAGLAMVGMVRRRSR